MPKRPSRPSPLPLLTLWLSLLLLLWSAVWAHLHEAQETRTTNALAQLRLIGESKARAVESWWQAHETDARMLAAAGNLHAPVSGLLLDGARYTRATDWLHSLLGELDYRDASLLDSGGVTRAAATLLDANGTPQASAGRAGIHGDDFPTAAVAQALASGRATFAETAGGEFVWVVPLDPVDGQPGGWLLLRHDPRELFDVIGGWPTPSPSGQVVLLRPDGDAIEFLNVPGRPRLQSAQLPLLPAPGHASNLDTVTTEGTDERGRAVYAAVRIGLGPGWTLLARQDRSEFDAVLRGHALNTLLLAVLASMVCTLAVWTAHRHQLDAALRVSHEELQGIVHARTVALSDSLTQLRAESDQRERMQAERDELFALSGDLFAIIDAHGRFARVNPAWASTLGHAPAALEGTSWHSWLHPDDRACSLAAGRELAAGRPVVALLNRYRHADGGWRWLEWTATADPARVRYYAVGRDVTERFETEQNLRLARRALDASLNGVLIADASEPGLPVLYANPAYERLSGYPLAEVLGRPCDFLTDAGTDAQAVAELHAALAEGCEIHTEMRCRRRNGEAFWTQLQLAPVRAADGSITHWVAIQQDVTTRKTIEARLAHQAGHDALTGLPNRTQLRERLRHALARARRAGTRVALLFIDLDRFKTINDSLGHPIGDALLCEAARRLAGAVREGDLLARIGGDEFVVALERIERPDDAARVAQKLLATLAAPLAVAGREFVLSASIGIGLYPDDAGDIDTLLRAADTAMYGVKRAGRDGYGYYESAMHEHALAALERERDLRGALERGEFELHYQPQVELASGRIVAVEALLRWRHPQRGLVPPDQFIPSAEESGLIVPIGDWVTRTACAQLAEWQRLGLGPLRMAVNLSARQFRRPEFVAETLAAVEAAGLAPGALELEITESLLMDDVERAIARMHALRDGGLALAIDDFGTGYSSLAYLKRFPVGLLKIDRLFVRDLAANAANAAIARTIVQLGQNLGLTVLAEGVEEAAQAELLRSFGCQLVQGWLTGRPQPAAIVRGLLEAQRDGRTVLAPAPPAARVVTLRAG